MTCQTTPGACAPFPSRAASARTVAGWIGSEVRGDGGLMLCDVATLADAGPNNLSYCDSPDRIVEAARSKAGCLIVPETADLDDLEGRTLIATATPQEAFVQVMLTFRPPRETPPPAVSLDAWIAPTAKLGEDVSIAPHVYIGPKARVGDGTRIGPNVSIMEGARIGQDCVLHPGVVVLADCVIGDRVILHPNAVVGSDGFGYRFEGGGFVKLPHTGRAVVEDDVEIGACTTVDRGMVGDTIVGAGSKLDNQVQIAHNVRIGRHNALAAHTGIAGSSRTGDYVRMGGQAGVADHVTIGSGVSLGAKAAVLSDVPDGSTMHGIPARPAREQMQIVSASAKLPAMRRQLRELERRLAEMEQQRKAA